MNCHQPDLAEPPKKHPFLKKNSRHWTKNDNNSLSKSNEQKKDANPI